MGDNSTFPCNCGNYHFTDSEIGKRHLKRYGRRPSKDKRVQRKRTKGWRMPPNTTYVGRPTKWGNPHTFDDDITRQQSIERYKLHILNKIKYELEKYDLTELKGKDLACWCPLDKPCHADVLLELMAMEEIEMHKETCLICGYEGYDDDTTVNVRSACPKCGATKLGTYPEGKEPEAIIAVRDALNQVRKEQSLEGGN